MAHLLLLEVPGSNDFQIMEDAVSLGHEITFFTADPACLPGASLAREIVLLHDFDYGKFEQAALAVHARDPFHGILCLIDIRMIEASRLAEKLGLRFLNSKIARLARDKFSVRAHLATRSIRQPRFALATSNEELAAAIQLIGFPVLVKPSDGYGSQNILAFHSEQQFNDTAELFRHYLPLKTDYGFGVHANDRLVVDEFIHGEVVGVETFTINGRHVFLGINDKLFFDPPCFGIKGSCFPSSRFDTEAIRDYVFRILDAMEFDFGAAHTEIIVTPDGPCLVEVNPRLIGAHIPRLLGLALERSVYGDVIQLHLGDDMAELLEPGPQRVAVSRWITASREGTLDAIILPEITDPGIRAVHLFRQAGDRVRPPFENADRLGYVMAVGATQEEAERTADAFVNRTRVILAG